MTSPSTSSLVVFNLFLALAFVFVALRLWARHMKGVRLQINDYAILVALILAIGLVISLNQCVTIGGAGQHIQDITQDEITTLLKEVVVVSVFWVSVNSAIKVSVAHFYTTLFPNRLFQIITNVTIWFVILYWVATVISTFLICRPFMRNWNLKINGTCGNLHGFWLASSIIGLFFDVLVVFLPMPMLWGLQLNRSRKLALMFIFGLGTFICIITILRIVANENIDFRDISYTSKDVLIWTALEPLLGIINACLPLMPPVLTKTSVVISGIARTLTKKGKSTEDSSTKYVRSSNGGAKKFSPHSSRFKRIHEPYELPSVMTIENCVAINDHDQKSANDDSDFEGTVPIPGEAIMVTRNWSVQSDPSAHV